MKKVLALVLALCVMIPVAAMAAGEVKIGQAYYAAHGTEACGILTVAMQDGVIVAAHIDEIQFVPAEMAEPLPNSDADFGANYPDGQTLASKCVNADVYSMAMAAMGGATQNIADSYAAIEAFAVGKTVAELEAAIAGKTSAEMVDAVSGATLADTLGYLTGLLEAAKSVQ